MIKLIFSKFEDINKTATFLEKNFITVIYEGFYCYLRIVKTFRALWKFFWIQLYSELWWNELSRNLLQENSSEEFPGSAAFKLTYSLILVTFLVHLALSLIFLAKTYFTMICMAISNLISVALTLWYIRNKIKSR